MNSKERVRRTLKRQAVDRVPANFQCTDFVIDKLLSHYGYSDMEQIYQHFDIDIRHTEPRYIGPELKEYKDENGDLVQETFWGYHRRLHETGYGLNFITCYHPLDEIETVEGLKEYNWPKAEWFDFSPITKTVEKYPDKAIIIGHPGPFQMSNNLRSMDKLFMDMIMNPEYAKTLFDMMVDFEYEYYKKMLDAGKGKIDILRPHDDYGTQISLLFSVDMWRQYFKENTKRLVELAHSYGAYYMQHSCGAVAPLINDFIECGIDALEPLQKVEGLYPENLGDYIGRITFHGGIDTQGILPFGTAEEVSAEAKKYIDTLGKEGGYILMSSQTLEGDVPIENIEALFNTDIKYRKADV